MTDAESRPTPEEPKPGKELQLMTEGDGLAIIGEATEVERFLVSQGLDRAPSKDLSHRLGSLMRNASALTQTGSEVAAHAGRWVKLTEESAAKVAALGLTPTTTPGISHAMIGERGAIESWIQIVTGPTSLVTNPAVLAGAAGVMAQIAMQQAMEEITEYLVAIDEKVNDLLRAHKDAVFADMIGASQMIDEAMTIREQAGRVSEVTWSKLHNVAFMLARTQAYALRQLDGLAEKLERKSEMGELASVAKDVEATVQEWLYVLAQCVRLQDGVAVLELDRVLDASPDQLNEHRVGLRLARENRLQLIARSTVQLIDRMNAAAERANAGVLIHPIASPSVVHSGSVVRDGVVEFQARLGLGREIQSLEARRWTSAAADAWDTAIKVGADGLAVANRIGSQTVQAFQAVDLDDDGIPDKPRALTALTDTGTTIAGAATTAAGAATTAAAAAAKAAGKISARLRRNATETPALEPGETEWKPS